MDRMVQGPRRRRARLRQATRRCLPRPRRSRTKRRPRRGTRFERGRDFKSRRLHHRVALEGRRIEWPQRAIRCVETSGPRIDDGPDLRVVYSRERLSLAHDSSAESSPSALVAARSRCLFAGQERMSRASPQRLPLSYSRTSGLLAAYKPVGSAPPAIKNGAGRHCSRHPT